MAIEILTKEARERQTFPSYIGVYQIECTANEKKYIGYSNDANRKIHFHLTALKSSKHEVKEMQNDFIKYGETVFVTKLLKEVRTNELDIMSMGERFDYINDLINNWRKTENSYSPSGYNTGVGKGINTASSKFDLAAKLKADKGKYLKKRPSSRLPSTKKD